MSASNIEKENITKKGLLECINFYLSTSGYPSVGLNESIYDTGIDSLDYIELNLILSEKFIEINYSVMYNLDMSRCKVIDIYNSAKGII